ncbi:GyrI-like domain-containing protein [Sutcliffiella rhizosphaerae]|uniref:AraC effector-binding domain-containing protein n=1 Tax=Sutcliffiella rhizosphaerae TaxID=2880967 RepID=A0ABM8YK80_9BACI|nr:GyrI-like domain-containing protein [Sutcliffiella rhizosphaerae]CAG9620260.1 hypothetical protein BACCIP111883_01028 [Sutcliffiella rhizosphaerae]
MIFDKKIMELGALNLVGFRVWCEPNEYPKEIGQASKQLDRRINEIKNRINPDKRYGAFIVDPSTPQEDGYWVAVAVAAIENTPDDMVSIIIPPQKYAAATYHGSNKNIFEAYDHLHTWAHSHGWERKTDKWHIEIFSDWEDQDKLEVQLLDTIQ